MSLPTIFEEEYVKQIIAAARSEDQAAAREQVWVLLNEFGQKWRLYGRQELLNQIKSLS